MENTKMRIIIVDDDKLVSLSLKTILTADPDIEVLEIGHSGTEAVELYRKYTPDVLLMDIRMQESNGLDAGEQIIKEYPDARILFLTTFNDDEYIVRALKIGAKGYLLKQDFESIAPSLHAVFKGQNVFGKEIVTKFSEIVSVSNDNFKEKFQVSDKEFDIIRLIADGLSNREIAESLYLSEGTVRNYLSTILEKMDLRDRTQLAVFYYKNK